MLCLVFIWSLPAMPARTALQRPQFTLQQQMVLFNVAGRSTATPGQALARANSRHAWGRRASTQMCAGQRALSSL